MPSNQVIRPCPVCGSDQPEPRWQKGGLRLVTCQACSMIYANPVPTEFASGAYYAQTGADYYLSPAKLESDYATVRYEREVGLFRKHCKGGMVLDVGCSSGGFLFQLNQRFPECYQVLGTDASGPPLDYAESRGIAVVRGSFLEQSYGRKEFDSVTFWAVLEHLLEPKQFLDKAWSLLKPGGFCFILVPNMDSLAVRLLQSRYRYVYAQHLNYFTRETLIKLIPTGFQVIEVRSTHFNPIVIWQDWRQRGQEVSNNDRAELLKRTTSYKQNPLLKPLKAIYKTAETALGALTLADNLVAVLRKKD